MTKAKDNKEIITIPAPKLKTMEIKIRGTAPLMQARFSQKAMLKMQAAQALGSQAKSKKVREPRDPQADFEAAKHISTEGWVGIPASAFRKALISACRLVNFKMTLAKLSVFVLGDGFDAVDGIPLIKLIAGEPEMNSMAVRNATGVCDLRHRPMWREWGANVRITFDEDQFSVSDITNLMSRVGLQVGIGEGRPDSKDSAGLGLGTFELVND